ncbi:MAG: hypothetical protein H0T46_20255 [Deltaproteobacteria bacterium]|nr:hypothetical protein [Deltaproteobacteria bacterium]
MRFCVVLLLAAVGSCSGGGAKQIAIGPTPAPRTTGTLAGPLCQYDQCSCADATHDPGVAEGGRKRFEIKLKSSQHLWASLPGDTVLYKTVEKPEVCFYVDLAPGQHPIRLRASNPNGVSAELQVREIGAKAKTMYSTFTFECGHPGVCSFEELDALKSTYAAVERGLHDKCGSTRIKNIGWDHGKAPDGSHPSELVIEATLDVYKFMPQKASGDPTCGPGDARRDGEPTGEPAGPPDGTDPAP